MVAGGGGGDRSGGVTKRPGAVDGRMNDLRTQSVCKESWFCGLTFSFLRFTFYLVGVGFSPLHSMVESSRGGSLAERPVGMGKEKPFALSEQWRSSLDFLFSALTQVWG